jgi:hypothetical protein
MARKTGQLISTRTRPPDAAAIGLDRYLAQWLGTAAKPMPVQPSKRFL